MPNQTLVDSILLARVNHDREIRFIRAIALGAPEWVPSGVIETQLGITSRQLGQAHQQLRLWVNTNHGSLIPLPWGHWRSPGSDHPAAYLMTSEVGAHVLQHAVVVALP